MAYLSLQIFISDKAKGEVKLYFQNPQQLLSIFADLEDENLSLIQECREAEGNLEKVRTSIQEVIEVLESEITSQTIMSFLVFHFV